MICVSLKYFDLYILAPVIKYAFTWEYQSEKKTLFDIMLPMISFSVSFRIT